VTCKEAIELLKPLTEYSFSKHGIGTFPLVSTRSQVEALNLAINVLEEKPQDDLIKAFELLKAHCKNRECNSDCIFYRELRVGNNKEQFCNLCEIVTSDDKENNND
jgi:hypothetical protein